MKNSDFRNFLDILGKNIPGLSLENTYIFNSQAKPWLISAKAPNENPLHWSFMQAYLVHTCISDGNNCWSFWWSKERITWSLLFTSSRSGEKRWTWEHMLCRTQLCAEMCSPAWSWKGKLSGNSFHLGLSRWRAGNKSTVGRSGPCRIAVSRDVWTREILSPLTI